VEMACGLSPELERGLDELLRAVVERLDRWGCECRPMESGVHA
jgi:hypothetical protein